MTTSSNFIDIHVRPRRSRGVRSSKKSILYSDYNGEEEANDGNLGQRSISLTTLPHGGPGSTSTAPTTASGPTLEPRMAQLETLEAKMASIEVSLSTTPRRKNGKKNGNTQLGLITKNSALGSSSAMNILASVRSNTLIDTCRELEVLRNALKDKENTIQNLQGQVNCCGRLTSPQPFDNAERRVAELRLQTLRQEEESRKAAIKRINLTLEQIDESESNIDVRIRQAELEYELGREELGLLGVREEMRALQARLDAKPMPTLYSCVSQSGRSSLHCVQLEYDPKSPRFGAGATDDKIGLFVLWAAEDSGLQKGDRILEVNGKMTLATSKEEMNRLLTVCPSKAEIVVNRPWSPPPTSEDFLRRENLRLTHRISYLEDQVAELLLQKEKSVPFKLAKYEKKQMEVFQKGSQVTVLQNPQTKSETHLTTVTINSPGSEKPYKSSAEVTVENGCNISVGPSEKYHEVESYHAYPGKGKIKALSKKYEKDEFSSTLSSYNRDCEEEEQHQQPHKTKLIFPKNSAPAETNHPHSDLDKPSCKSNNYYNRVVDYSSESSSNRYRANASVKSLDLESRRKTENDDREIQENGKPLPPRKPVRLSIHRATSLQNVETGYSLHNAIRKIKKTHKSEAPPPPTQESHSVNGEIYRINHSDSNQSPFRWPVHQRSKSKRTEKWC